MGDVEALNIGLWVISDFLRGLVEGAGVHVHIFKGVVEGVYKTQVDDSVIGGTEVDIECTCRLENNFLSWTSRVLADNRVPLVRIGKKRLRERIAGASVMRERWV